MKIGKQTKISDLLEKYPFLIEEMEKINNHFALLKNKAARMTMAKIATVSMASKAAGLSAAELMNAIKKIVAEHGVETLEIDTDDERTRLDTLKEIIKEMHQGGDPAAAKIKFNELLKEIDPHEIKDLEQQLVMEGMPVSEIQNLCELHVGVFKDALGKSDNVVVEAGHPVHTYQEENRRLEEAIARLEALLKRLDEENKAQVIPEARAALAQVATVEKHYVRKENQLFPFMEKHGITAPPQVMWGVHDEIRSLIKKAKKSLDTEDAAEIKKTVTELNHAMTEMIFKEEKILFPMVLQNITEDEWEQIRRGEDELGYILGVVPGDVWKPKGAGQTKTRDDVFSLDTGRMTIRQINALLKHLPLDISFVDENDEVLYYSETAERFFPRSPGVIGRKVQNCHPPKSVHIVQEIVEAFRAGRKNSAEFWINLRGRTLHIRYFAVRNDAGKYLGTLEVTQDITDIKRIEGERRLLDWNKSS
ncbi:MAG TPA: DUF438 domain-containing protein [Smithellaceae bacterium]|nr:DUF438 domain-containing protein [Smithellaceae bacterium]HRS89370.1 DUF438 domain-containing protein [Smithellaceae bacterium]HRV26575.1 DUF438 domain-containing protein [Smithellaceae bacterium]